LLPNLDLLDSKDKDGDTVDSDEDGKYSKASPKCDSSEDSDYKSDDSSKKKAKRIKHKKE